MKSIKIILASLAVSFVIIFIVAPQIISPQLERTSNRLFMSPNERWHDWEFVSSLPNPDNSAIAVIETNKHFGPLKSGGLIRLSLKSGSEIISVWESFKVSEPKYNWLTNRNININYEEYSVGTFKPEVTINANEYKVTLDMNAKVKSVEDFDEEWSWTVLENTPNVSNNMLVVTERGKHPHAAPIIRYSVSDNSGKVKEIWQGTEQNTNPTISWVSDSTLELVIEDNHFYSFFPTRRFSTGSVSVELKVKAN